jgi:hypothetical protein
LARHVTSRLLKVRCIDLEGKEGNAVFIRAETKYLISLHAPL